MPKASASRSARCTRFPRIRRRHSYLYGRLMSKRRQQLATRQLAVVAERRPRRLDWPRRRYSAANWREYGRSPWWLIEDRNSRAFGAASVRKTPKAINYGTPLRARNEPTAVPPVPSALSYFVRHAHRPGVGRDRPPGYQRLSTYRYSWTATFSSRGQGRAVHGPSTSPSPTKLTKLPFKHCVAFRPHSARLFPLM